jgi:hypothetical protein
VLIQQLAHILGVPPQCPPSSSFSPKRALLLQPKQRPPRILDPTFVDWITQHADWDQEARVGYYPPPSEIK